MITKIQKWGNSQGLRISKELLSAADIDVGEEVQVELREGALTVTPLRRTRGGHDLRKLVAGIPKGNLAEEVDWGVPVGREAW